MTRTHRPRERGGEDGRNGREGSLKVGGEWDGGRQKEMGYSRLKGRRRDWSILRTRMGWSRRMVGGGRRGEGRG